MMGLQILFIVARIFFRICHLIYFLFSQHVSIEHVGLIRMI